MATERMMFSVASIQVSAHAHIVVGLCLKITCRQPPACYALWHTLPRPLHLSGHHHDKTDITNTSHRWRPTDALAHPLRTCVAAHRLSFRSPSIFTQASSTICSYHQSERRRRGRPNGGSSSSTAIESPKAMSSRSAAQFNYISSPTAGRREDIFVRLLRDIYCG